VPGWRGQRLPPPRSSHRTCGTWCTPLISPYGRGELCCEEVQLKIVRTYRIPAQILDAEKTKGTGFNNN